MRDLTVDRPAGGWATPPHRPAGGYFCGVDEHKSQLQVCVLAAGGVELLNRPIRACGETAGGHRPVPTRNRGVASGEYPPPGFA